MAMPPRLHRRWRSRRRAGRARCGGSRRRRQQVHPWPGFAGGVATGGAGADHGRARGGTGHMLTARRRGIRGITCRDDHGCAGERGDPGTRSERRVPAVAGQHLPPPAPGLVTPRLAHMPGSFASNFDAYPDRGVDSSHGRPRPMPRQQGHVIAPAKTCSAVRGRPDRRSRGVRMSTRRCPRRAIHTLVWRWKAAARHRSAVDEDAAGLPAARPGAPLWFWPGRRRLPARPRSRCGQRDKDRLDAGEGDREHAGPAAPGGRRRPVRR